MMKKVSLSLLVALSFLGVKNVVSADQQISQIKADVERIALAERISAMTIPEAILDSWDAVEEQLRTQVDLEIEIQSDKLKQTFRRYKDLMESAIIAGKIDQLSLKNQTIDFTSKETPCDMYCVDVCFTESAYRFENVQDVYQICLVAQCNCTSGEISYQPEDNGFTSNMQQWELSNFGSDRDLYDKDGNQIYDQDGEDLYHRDLNSSGDWSDSWHIETNETVHDVSVREKENYYEKLQEFSWISAPFEYDLLTQCNLTCSEDCLTLRNQVPLQVLDSCQVNRCNCYYSLANYEICTPECMRSCMLVEGGQLELFNCVRDVCQCGGEEPELPTLDAPLADIEETVVDLITETIIDVTSTPVDDSSLANPTSTLSLYKDEVIPTIQADIPILSIVVSFSILMMIILLGYFVLLRMEARRKRKVRSGYEYISEKNSYTQKISFLDNQEITATTL